METVQKELQVLYVGHNSETIKLLVKIFKNKKIKLTVSKDLESADKLLRGKRKYFTLLMIHASVRKDRELNANDRKQDGINFAEKKQIEGEKVVLIYDSVVQCTFLTRFVCFSRYNIPDIKDYLISIIRGLPQLGSE